MPAPDISLLSPAPSRMDSPAVFDDKSFAFVDDLEQMVVELNAFIEWLNAADIESLEVPPNNLLGRHSPTTGAPENITLASELALVDGALRLSESGAWQRLYLISALGSNPEYIRDILFDSMAAYRTLLRSALLINNYAIVTLAATAENLTYSPNTEGLVYFRLTNAAAKTYTVRPNSTHNVAIGAAFNLRNAGAGLLTIVAGAGVTINAPAGGTLTVALNGSVTLICVALNVYDLIGQVVAA